MLEKFTEGLTTALGLRATEHVGIVGAGGKTSLMFSLAEELRMKGCRVVTATTTKVWYKEARRFPRVIISKLDSDWCKTVRTELKTYGHVFVGHGVLETGKLEGITPGLAEKIYHDSGVDYLVLEADGAAGLLVKAPASHEPVIPSSVTLVVAMMGLDAVGKALKPEIVFRLERFKRATGLMDGAKIDFKAIGKIFHSPRGLFKGSPDSARRVAFLNKLDLLSDDQEAKDLANVLLSPPNSLIDRVVIGSIKEKKYFIIGKKP